jgi:hypothetical protein
VTSHKCRPDISHSHNDDNTGFVAVPCLDWLLNLHANCTVRVDNLCVSTGLF